MVRTTLEYGTHLGGITTDQCAGDPKLDDD
jgi:hypothetical protein